MAPRMDSVASSLRDLSQCSPTLVWPMPIMDTSRMLLHQELFAMSRIGGIVNLDAPGDVLPRGRDAVAPVHDVLRHAQAKGITARAAAKRHRQDAVAGL